MLFPILYVNGQFVPKEEALIPVYDLGLLRGLGIFDFFRVIDSVPIFVEDHLERLQRSLDLLDLQTGLTAQDWTGLIYQVIRVNNARRAGFRVVVTGGFSEDGYSIPAQKNIYLMAHTLPENDPAQYANGIRILTAEYHRDMPEAKTTIYVKSMTMQQKLKAEKAYEVLYHWNGQLFECSRCNIFFIDPAGELHTPARGMLKGITRKQIIDIASQHGIAVHERDIQLSEIGGMAGAFLTATTKGALPVVKIDDLPVGDGGIHPLAVQLNQWYEQRVADYIRNAVHPLG